MKYFDISEFDCSETGENYMNPAFLAILDMLREHCGFPFVITSGYRSPKHSIEAAKKEPGLHSKGIAADISAPDGVRKRKIVEEALKLGFGGIGVGKDFIHVDTRPDTPVVWGY